MPPRPFDVSRHAYAHRGLWGGHIPENSLAAFSAARNSGVGVELDVRLTRDRVPVVFHDATLERMCNRDCVLSEITFIELGDAKLPDGSIIPELDDVLDVLGDAPVLLELKVDTPADTAIADVVSGVIEGRAARHAVMSFDVATVGRLSGLNAIAPVGLLINADDRMHGDDKHWYAQAAKKVRCDFLAPHFSLLPAVAAATNLPLVTWTLRHPEQLALARRHGAAPIFEGFSPTVALAALEPI